MFYFKSSKGIILFDILLAFSLSFLFIAIISEASINSRQIFERAKARAELLDVYEETNMNSPSKLYGNNQSEMDFSLSSSTGNLSFVKIAMNENAGLNEAVGTPYCSVDYFNSEAAGSYQYFQSLNDSGQPNFKTAAITPITLPIDPLLPLTDLEVRNGIAYISTDSSIASDPDLIIVDISDPNAPRIISTINTGPGLSSIALAGKRIFAAATSAAAQLHIIRMDGLSNPFLEKKFKLSLPYATATPPLASAIFFNNNKVYLGTEKWDGDEFSIIDVSNPLAPITIGGFETNSKINDIYVKNGIAYAAASDQNQLRVLDVGDPANPILVNSFGPSGWQRQEGKAISFFEDGLNLGRTSGGFNFTTDHEAFAWASTSSTTLINPKSVDIPGGVYGIIKDRFRIYLATRQINREFQVLDSQFTTSTTVSYSLPIQPQAMACDRDNIYILAHSAPVIYEINFMSHD